MNIEIAPIDPNSDGAKLAAEFAKEREYPESYKGPKAGKSPDREWTAVRDYDAFRYVRDGVWSYSDFDCYLYAMCQKYHQAFVKKS